MRLKFIKLSLAELSLFQLIHLPDTPPPKKKGYWIEIDREKVML